MDITSIASASSSMAQTGIKQEVGIAMLKKAQDIDKASAATLIEALPAAQRPQNLPANLGNTIDTTA
jgi:hypothetical protein